MSFLFKIILFSINLYVAFPAKTKSSPSVIIIGAGPAGIAAGRRLYENGFDVRILEAENRIGGRVHSVKFGDAYVDLGAEWCHGEDGNIVYQMVKDMGVLRHSEYDYHFYFSDRNYIDDEFNAELFELYDVVYTADGNRNQSISTTVGEYSIRIFNSTIHEKWGNDKDKFRIATMCLESFHRLALSDEGAFSWFDVPATNDYRNCEGDLELNWSGRGYKTILEVLLKRFPTIDRSFRLDKFIKVNKEVTKVIYEDDFTVARCSDGSEYVADHIIFTPSLGVLKHQYKTLFSPPLGKRKVQIIKELGISAVSKVILHFPWRWWPKRDFTGWSFVWTFEDKEMLPVDFPYGPIRHDQHWLRNIMSIYRLEENPRALSLWFTGEFVPDIELMDADILIEGILYMLDKFFGDVYYVPYPDKMIRSDWYSNPHFHGTYSYQTIEARTHFVPSPNLVLAEPVMSKNGIPRLLFAGEATNQHHYSTVHGAIETGFREADRLIQIYEEK